MPKKNKRIPTRKSKKSRNAIEQQSVIIPEQQSVIIQPPVYVKPVAVPCPEVITAVPCPKVIVAAPQAVVAQETCTYCKRFVVKPTRDYCCLICKNNKGKAHGINCDRKI